MDEQTKDPATEQDSVNQSAPTPPMVNDITPPPPTASSGSAPTAVAPKIDIKIDSDDTTEEQTDGSVSEVGASENVVDEGSNSDEDMAPLAIPPEEETVAEDTNPEEAVDETRNESNDEQASSQTTDVPFNTEPQENSEKAENIVQQEQPGFGVPNKDQNAPAAMGVAASQMNKHPHRNNKKLAAIVTVVVALLLAGVAVYVYMSANTNTENASGSVNDTNATESSEQKVADITPATSADVETTTTDVEQAITALDETADFADNDLSDTSLGL